uniref:RABX5 catalytic core helical domain-containing protein n=1 Tax=Zea mays TaxID=4577 RepID=A0A804QBL9_MAIZE
MGTPCLARETLGAAGGEAWLAAMDVDSRMATESDSDSDARGGSGSRSETPTASLSPFVDGSKVQAFLVEMESAIRDHPLWANTTDQEIDHTLEGLEKYVMTKLFDRTFGTSTEDAVSDMDISEKIGLLQLFVKPHHLDIPKVVHNEASWLVTHSELEASTMRFQSLMLVINTPNGIFALTVPALLDCSR